MEKQYVWLPLQTVLKYEPEMQRLGVSKVARGVGGFLWRYKKIVRPRAMGEYWQRRRLGFIKRHMAQYRTHPTERRWLALVAWAYRPDRRFG